MTFFGVKIQPSACLGVQVKIKTKALSIVSLDSAHQALINLIIGQKKGGLNCRQISEKLNNEGITSSRGKRFYSALVFSVIKKERLKADRLAYAELVVNTTLEK